jgi:hypothetical protein
MTEQEAAQEVETETAVETPAETPEAAPEAAAEEVSTEAPSTKEALAKAFETLDTRDAAESGEQPTPEPEAQDDRPRNPDGTFAKVEGEKPAAEAAKAPEVTAETPETPAEPETVAKFSEPPSRFSPDAKAVWNDAPEPVKAEITRAVTELEQGIEQHRAAFEPYKSLDADLQARGQNINDVVAHYSGIENLLRSNPIQGFNQICQNLGVSLHDIAAQVMGQPADQRAVQQDSLVSDLRNQISSLQQEIQGVKTTVQTQTEEQVLKQIQDFAADKPRFEELAGDITMFLNSGRVAQDDLQGAYDLAERLNPAPNPTPAPTPEVPAPTPATEVTQPAAAQTRKGQLSPSGAPSSGSNPANKKPPSSAREAIAGAFAQVGIAS